MLETVVFLCSSAFTAIIVTFIVIAIPPPPKVPTLCHQSPCPVTLDTLPLTSFLASSFRCPLLVLVKREQLNSKGRGQRTDGPLSSLHLGYYLSTLAGSLRPRVSASVATLSSSPLSIKTLLTFPSHARFLTLLLSRTLPKSSQF